MLAGQPSAKPVIAGQSPQAHSSMARFPGHRTTLGRRRVGLALDRGTGSSSGSSRARSCSKELRLVHCLGAGAASFLLADEELWRCWEGRKKDAAGMRKAFVRVGNEPNESGPSSASLASRTQQLLGVWDRQNAAQPQPSLRLHPHQHSAMVTNTHKTQD